MGFLGLFGPPNVAKLKEKRDVQGLTKMLKYENWLIRGEALDALVEIGDISAVESLVEIFSDKWPNVKPDPPQLAQWQIYEFRVIFRAEAAKALGRIGDARAVEPLIVALNGNPTSPQQYDRETSDSRATARAEAAKALGRIGDARAVEPLIVALKDDCITVRSEAAWALGAIGDTRAVIPLSNTLQHDAYEDVYQNAAWALSKFGTVGIDILINVLSNLGRSHAARTDVLIEVLGAQKDKRAILPLVEKLKDENTSCYSRALAAKSLDMLDWKPDEDETWAWYWIANEKVEKCIEIGKQAWVPLVTAVNDPFYKQRFQAFDALPKIDEKRAVHPLLVLASNINCGDYEHTVIVKILIQIARNTAEPFLDELKNKDGDERLHALAKEVLAKKGWDRV